MRVITKENHAAVIFMFCWPCISV